MNDLKDVIEEAFEHRAQITPRNVNTHVREAVQEAVALLDSGRARVAEPGDSGWVVNEWL
ncbi:MAG TPA: 2,3,4,5-tetrahydropyridine-2,6-dicarboxylate N-succinyltransferase, partial [Chromatiales bacterium]|nr:2,3,4,5-tetrahydropyridine-2,6-dicarboxylate N-succinyltransferase [Chromatiales bacterium]